MGQRRIRELEGGMKFARKFILILSHFAANNTKGGVALLLLVGS